MTTRRAALNRRLLACLGALLVAGLYAALHAGTAAPPPALALAVDDPTPEPGDGMRIAEPTRRQRVGAPADGGFYSAPVGSAFDYAFSAKARTGLVLDVEGHRATQHHATELRGALRVVVADRRDDEIVIALTLPEVTAHEILGGAGGVRHEDLERGLGHAVLVRMRHDGSTLGFRFADDASPYARNWVRSLVAGFRVVVPRDAAGAWETEEEDPTGMARVRYTWTRVPGEDGEGQIEKNKLSYVPHAQDGMPALECTVHGRATAEMSANLGWRTAAAVHERLTSTPAGTGFETSVDYDATLSLEQAGHCAAADLPAVDWNAAWSAVHGLADLDAIAADSEAAYEASFVGDAGLADLVAEIERLVAADPVDNGALVEAFRKLTALVRTDARALESMEAVVTGATADAAEVILSAVGAANTPEAQAYLAGFVTEPHRPAGLVRAGLQSMFQIGEPSAEALDAARSIAEGPYRGDYLRDSGVLLMGALASREPATGSREAVVADLIAYEPRARQNGAVENWLHALGNAAHPATLAPAGRYLQHSDPDLRRAAVGVLARVETAEARQLLAAHARSETHPAVRAAARNALSEKS